MPVQSKPDNCQIVIFGASGDLTKRKLVPALFDLYANRQMPEKFCVLGISRSELSDDAFRERMHDNVKEFAQRYDDKLWKDFAPHLHYQAGDTTQLEHFDPIKQRIRDLAEQHGTGQSVLFYLSLSPALYDATIDNIGQAGMVTEGKAWCSLDRFNRPWQRVIIEKPFGRDPESAAHLNRVLGRVFEEDDTYRIDHYLGKETVQNLLVFRFANAIFEPLWNRTYIDHVQLTAAETVGVEGRGGYYDSSSGGAMRDMIQSHLMQVMALVAMEPPVRMEADDIRREKSKILFATREPREDDVPRMAVRGQYGPGQVNGEAVPGYRDEEGVDRDSQRDTYAALKVYIDNWRWQGVPFYLRSGKRMAKKTTEVVVNFREAPHALFRNVDTGRTNHLMSNQIVINIQPNEGIRLRFEGKVPGLGTKIKPVIMDFDYAEQFKADPPEAYATLLMDAMRGDRTLYKHRDEVEGAWRAVQPVLDYWEAHDQDDLPNYAAGTWGPSAADVMLDRDNRAWHNR